MENLTYGFFSQYECNGTLSKENHPAPWQFYGDTPSVRSSITGNILIVDDKFYDTLPLRPISSTEIIVVTNNRDYAVAEERVVITHSLKEALSYEFQENSKKKRFIANSPFLDIERQLLYGWSPDEIFTMRPYEKIPCGLNSDPTGWKLISRFIVPKSKEHPCDLVFCHYKKIAQPIFVPQ